MLIAAYALLRRARAIATHAAGFFAFSHRISGFHAVHRAPAIGTLVAASRVHPSACVGVRYLAYL